MAGMGFLLGILVPGREPEPSEAFSALGLTSKILHQTNTSGPLCGGAVKSAFATGILKSFTFPAQLLGNLFPSLHFECPARALRGPWAIRLVMVNKV